MNNKHNVKRKRYQIVETREDCMILMETDAHQSDFARRIIVEHDSDSQS